jgi:hypothetical protein
VSAQQGEQGVVHGASRASPVRRDRASPAKQGEHQEYIDVLSLHRQSIQNKQCFHNIYAYLSAARAAQHRGPDTKNGLMPARYEMKGSDLGQV